MRTSSLAGALALVVVLAGCAKPHDFTAFHRVSPRSILIVPPVNRSLDVTASNYMLSTLTIPLAELGYYVFPVNTVKILLEQEGLYEPERVREAGPEKLAALFGADAVLYVTIRRWEATYAILSTQVTVDLEYEMNAADGTPIWAAKKAMVYVPQQQQGGGIAALIAQAIVAAATRAAPDYMPLARQANAQVLIVEENTKLPPGPYRRDAKKP